MGSAEQNKATHFFIGLKLTSLRKLKTGIPRENIKALHKVLLCDVSVIVN